MENKGSKALKIALTISLCLNLFLLSAGAVIFLKLRMLKTPKGRIEYIGRYLKLSRAQKIELWRSTKPIRKYRSQAAQERSAQINELCDELSKNDPDYEKINQIIGSMVEERAKFLGLAAQQLEPILKGLTLEQRQIIVNKIKGLPSIENGNSRLANSNIF